MYSAETVQEIWGIRSSVSEFKQIESLRDSTYFK